MEKKSGKGNIGQYLDLGFQFAIAIAIGAGGGYWLDLKIHTPPLFLVLGLLLGATSGFLAIYRTVYPSGSQKGKEREGEG